MPKEDIYFGSGDFCKKQMKSKTIAHRMSDSLRREAAHLLGRGEMGILVWEDLTEEGRWRRLLIPIA